MDYSLPHHLRVFDVTEGGAKLENGRLFVEVSFLSAPLQLRRTLL
jgi:hypothetical protein